MCNCYREVLDGRRAPTFRPITPHQPGTASMTFSFVDGPFDGAVITDDAIRAKCWFATGALLLKPPATVWDAWSREDFDGGKVIPKHSSIYRRDAATTQPTYRFIRRADNLP